MTGKLRISFHQELPAVHSEVKSTIRHVPPACGFLTHIWGNIGQRDEKDGDIVGLMVHMNRGQGMPRVSTISLISSLMACSNLKRMKK